MLSNRKTRQSLIANTVQKPGAHVATTPAPPVRAELNEVFMGPSDPMNAAADKDRVTVRKEGVNKDAVSKEEELKRIDAKSNVQGGRWLTEEEARIHHHSQLEQPEVCMMM
jgi:hypothetical protein